MAFSPASAQLFFSRNDPNDPRLGELFSPQDGEKVSPNQISLWGYPDDEGISLNGGRVGAALAPDQIRTFLYKMTPDLFSNSKLNGADLGNLNAKGLTIDLRHEQARAQTRGQSERSRFFVSLGGGHDYGFPDAAGFCEHWLSKGARPLVLNFDAHLDVRPLDRGLTSGTPFFRLLSELSGKFDFFEIGIQPQCNSKSHLTWATEKGASIAPVSTLQQTGLLNYCKAQLLKHSEQPCFISLDIDVFSSRSAPGCSQSWDFGIEAQDFFEIVPWLSQQLKLKGLGVYEVAPPLDADNRTSKLAALLIHRFLYCLKS